jgi:hypothetical protein
MELRACPGARRADRQRERERERHSARGALLPEQQRVSCGCMRFSGAPRRRADAPSNDLLVYMQPLRSLCQLSTMFAGPTHPLCPAAAGEVTEPKPCYVVVSDGLFRSRIVILPLLILAAIMRNRS